MSLFITVVFAFLLGGLFGFILGRQVSIQDYRKARKAGFKERLRQETFEKSPLDYKHAVDVAEEAKQEVTKEMKPKKPASARNGSGSYLFYIMVFLLVFILAYRYFWL